MTLPIKVQEFPLNAKDSVVIALSEYNGRKTIDCRKYYRSDEGELRPTPKGLTIAVTHLPALAAAIAMALETAEPTACLATQRIAADEQNPQAQQDRKGRQHPF
jgi:Transcriptional Coactivator p15 (PC4)